MTTILTTLLLLTPAGLDLFGHKAKSSACCDACGGETLRIQQLIGTMQCHPNWRERDDAAHALRRYDAECHPEIGSALAATMLHDCHEEVREEAAESLAKLAPCQPDVHAALARTADCDPDHATRKWARKALRNLDHECKSACSVCETTITTVPTQFRLSPMPAGLVIPRSGTFGSAAPVVVPTPPADFGRPEFPGMYRTAPNTLESPYGVAPSPLDALPPLEVAPPEMPVNPSPFLPGASRENREDERVERDDTPVRRASGSRDREPVIVRFGQRLFGGAR